MLSVAAGVAAQGINLDALKKDYPLLTKRYADKLQDRRAHYIFAIDISSSMTAYEKVVRESLVKFVQAVPDGDQITIIVMSDENRTNYLDMTKCITLNPELRNSIIQTVSGNEFRFMRNGDPNDGSDGFTMTRKVLEAMNVVNSSDLTFAYLLTDFEYWTHKNRYNKNNEDWASLKPMLTDKHRGMLCKYGIELTFNSVQHPEAVFKSELDNIFGPLDYQQAASAQMLSQWFGHIINDIQAHKINAMLKADWKEYLDSCSVKFRTNGRELQVVVEAPQSDLATGCHILLSGLNSEHLVPSDTAVMATSNDGNWIASVGRYEGELTPLPSHLEEDAAAADITVMFDSPYAGEINKLQGLCQENEQSPDAVNLNQNYKTETPAVKIWNAKWPWWAYLLTVLAIAFLIGSFIYELSINPSKRYTTVMVRRRGGGVSNSYNGETSRLPISIGNGEDVNVPGASWKLTIKAKKYNIITTGVAMIFGKKFRSGYYAELESGDYAEIYNAFTDNKEKTLSCGKRVFLFPYRKAPKSYIVIEEGTTNNKIEIS